MATAYPTGTELRPNWSGAFSYPPYILPYPTVVGGGLDDVLADDDDATYVRLGWGMTKTPNDYFYPPDPTGLPGTDIQDYFEAHWPGMPTLEDPSRDLHYTEGYGIWPTFSIPENSEITGCGIRLAFLPSGVTPDHDDPSDGTSNDFEPMVFMSDIPGTELILAGENQDQARGSQQLLLADAPDQGFHTYTFTGDFSGGGVPVVAPNWSYYYNVAGVNPEWLMEVKIAKLWVDYIPSTVPDEEVPYPEVASGPLDSRTIFTSPPS